MGSKISKTSYYLPETVLSNDDLSAIFPEIDFQNFEKKIGIQRRHIAMADETALDMAVKVGTKLLEEYDKNKIDFVILCTQSPDYFLPTSACIIQDRLGLNRIGSYDFNLGCSGYVYGLAMAKGFIEANIAQNILLFTSETYSKFIYEKDRSNRAIFGDAATATIIEKSDFEHINQFCLKSDGAGAEHLIVKNGAAKTPAFLDADEYLYGTDNITTDNNLYMNGPEIFNFTIENIPALIQETLDKNKLVIDEIDYVIFHQANKFMLNYLRRKLKIKKEKFHIDLTNYGNTVSSTIPIALCDAISRGNVYAGDKILLAGFGVGLSMGATIINL